MLAFGAVPETMESPVCGWFIFSQSKVRLHDKSTDPRYNPFSLSELEIRARF